MKPGRWILVFGRTRNRTDHRGAKIVLYLLAAGHAHVRALLSHPHDVAATGEDFTKTI